MALIALMAFTASTSGATISLTPLDQTVIPGNTVTVQIDIDFSDDPTLGGAFDLNFDAAALSFATFAFDAGFGGTQVLGTVTFDAVIPGTLALALAANALPANGFFFRGDEHLPADNFRHGLRRGRRGS